MKSGIIAIVGRTNVGKSTLMNRMLDEKVSIVSPVVQTTRNIIRGILTDRRGQMALLDTPGVHRAQNELGRIMNQRARQVVQGADAVLLMVDGSIAPRQEDEGWMRRLAKESTPLVIAVNKCDLARSRLADHEAVWRAARSEAAERAPAEWISLSAHTGENVAALEDRLFGLLPEGPALFPEEMLSDFPRKLNMADIVREKLVGQLSDELPHAIAVHIEQLDDSGDPWQVEAAVYVNRFSQKGIVIGHKGRLIRKVQRQAQAELSSMYETGVKLRLRVKVQENWAKNFWTLKQLGYA